MATSARRVFPSQKVASCTGLQTLARLGLPAEWILWDSPVLKTRLDFQPMEVAGGQIRLKSTQEACTQIGTVRGLFKLDNREIIDAIIVCGLDSGNIWMIDQMTPSHHEQFVNSNSELLERFLQEREEILHSATHAEYATARARLLSMEPSLGSREAHNSFWTGFIETMDAEFDARHREQKPT